MQGRRAQLAGDRLAGGAQPDRVHPSQQPQFGRRSARPPGRFAQLRAQRHGVSGRHDQRRARRAALPRRAVPGGDRRRPRGQAGAAALCGPPRRTRGRRRLHRRHDLLAVGVHAGARAAHRGPGRTAAGAALARHDAPGSGTADPRAGERADGLKMSGGAY
ncbi:conserved hypothetical protein [Ricinus communis]|uniref:Uncharacterized protein n=1 Tax=Ricinus communis TaxID=3988 RepID=B9TF51_RICCO|nr:conserved hypothetical protein [Ricinus communis]